MSDGVTLGCLLTSPLACRETGEQKVAAWLDLRLPGLLTSGPPFINLRSICSVAAGLARLLAGGRVERMAPA